MAKPPLRPKHDNRLRIQRKRKADKLREIRVQIARRRYEVGLDLFNKRFNRLIKEAQIIDDKELYIGSEIEALRQNLENQNKRELIESNCLNLLAKIKDLRSRNKSAYLEILKMERFLNIMRNTNDRRIVEQAKNYLRGLNEIKKGFLAQTKQAKRNVKVLNAILKSKD